MSSAMLAKSAYNGDRREAGTADLCSLFFTVQTQAESAYLSEIGLKYALLFIELLFEIKRRPAFPHACSCLKNGGNV